MMHSFQIIFSRQTPNSDGDSDYVALFYRAESSLNYLEVAEHLLMRYELSVLPSIAATKFL